MSAGMNLDEAAIIRGLNDRFRLTLIGGQVMMTAGLRASLDGDQLQRVMTDVRGFADFGEDNDPHGEHDYGSFEADGMRIIWKIDYYDRDLLAASPDPANPEVTTRVLTIMLASEW